MWLIGNHKLTTLSVRLGSSVEAACGFKPSTILKFWRLLKDDTVYYSVEYLKAAKRASFAVSYTQNSTLSFGLIQYFVEVRDGERESVLAVLHILHTQRVQSMPHLYETEETGIFKPVPIVSIVAKCVLLKTNTKAFIANYPSRILATLT